MSTNVEGPEKVFGDFRLGRSYVDLETPDRKVQTQKRRWMSELDPSCETGITVKTEYGFPGNLSQMQRLTGSLVSFIGRRYLYRS